MVTDTEQMAQVIKGRMKSKGWGIRDLAEASGIPEIRLTNRLTGLTDFRLSEMSEIAEALDVTPGDLLASADRKAAA